MPENLTAVAMSGGVDSSVVAAMMSRSGRKVAGFTMQLWNQRRLPEIQTDAATGRCCSLDDVYDARSVAQHLGIPFYVVNFEQRFEEQVVRPFIDEYLAGRTPIPCTLCNNYVKFDHFIEMAGGIGADEIATGHYARIDYNDASGRYELKRGADPSKDQTYFLFGLTQQQLARTRFPLGHMQKFEVRRLAHEYGLNVASKNDSQEICFVPNGDYAAFIDAYFKEQGVAPATTHGQITDAEGRVLGEHRGVHQFTVGQRKGLGIASGEPLYVIATKPETQTVIVGKGEELLRASCQVKDVNWISVAELREPLAVHVKIRNKHVAAPATVYPTADGARVQVRFDSAQRAVTPGQAAVFYQGDVVAGGGWIE
ncbi:MAG TPA: tRNA 2-thiouridine(34) synthase MnmA [Bryobacteraceae bacterium]|nr:tRNA 2-thiouridine(34) synthase MnmA [Bryobacteraceae bacterium]